MNDCRTKNNPTSVDMYRFKGESSVCQMTDQQFQLIAVERFPPLVDIILSNTNAGDCSGLVASSRYSRCNPDLGQCENSMNNGRCTICAPVFWPMENDFRANKKAAKIVFAPSFVLQPCGQWRTPYLNLYFIYINLYLFPNPSSLK